MEAIRRELGVERIAHLRHLLRHQGRARLRAPLPGARGAAGARLGGRRRTARTRSTATPSRRRRAPCGRSAAAPAAPSRAIRSADLERARGAAARAGPCAAGSWTSTAGCRRSSLTRTDVFGVLLAGDFDPALRAAFPGAVRSALRRRRRVRCCACAGARSGWTARPPPPRLLSAALYAATTLRGDRRSRGPRTSPPDPALRLRQAAAGGRRAPGVRLLPVRPRHGAAHATCSRSAPAGRGRGRGARARPGAAAERAGAAARGRGRPAHAGRGRPAGGGAASPRPGS